MPQETRFLLLLKEDALVLGFSCNSDLLCLFATHLESKIWCELIGGIEEKHLQRRTEDKGVIAEQWKSITTLVTILFCLQLKAVQLCLDISFWTEIRGALWLLFEQIVVFHKQKGEICLFNWRKRLDSFFRQILDPQLDSVKLHFTLRENRCNSWLKSLQWQ